MIRKILFILLTCVIGPSLFAEKIVLAKDGKPCATIVLPARPDPKLTAAAADLQSYVRRICGVDLPIVKTGKKVAGCGLYIGENELTAPEDRLPDSADPDTIVRNVRSGNVFFHARTVTAISWSVYTMIQEVLGVRWFAPGPDWEYVPESAEKGTLEIEVKGKIFTPSISPRTWAGYYTTPLTRQWCGRQRLMTNEIRRKAGFGNNIFRIFPPEKYAKTHPEYYPLINGKRFIPGPKMKKWRPCESNPEVQKIVADYIRNYFNRNPYADSFSLGLDDVFHLCQCENCRAMDHSADDLNNVSYSSRHYKFVNLIAEEIAKTHPRHFVGTLIYSPTRRPPEDVPKMEDNVCAYITQNAARWHDPEIRKDDMALTEEWSKRIKHLSRYEYIGLSCVTPRYYPHLLDEALRFDLKHRFIGMYQEVNPVLPTAAPMVWALAELQWDAGRSMDSLLDEFMTKMYGESAPEMKEYFGFLEKCWNRNGLKTWVFNDLKVQASVMTVAELHEAERILERALKIAVDPMVKKRIQVTKDALAFGGFVIEEFDLCKPWQGARAANREEAHRILEAARKLASTASRREKFWTAAMTADNILGETLRALLDRNNICIGQICNIEYDLLKPAVEAMFFLRKNDPEEFRKQIGQFKTAGESNFVQTVLGALSPADEKSGNYLPNGNFERLNRNGVPAGWDTWGYMPSAFTAEKNGGRNGSHAGRHNRNVSSCYLYYQKVKPGEIYYAEAWYKGTGGFGTLAFEFQTPKGKYHGPELAPKVSVPVTADWQCLRISAKIPAGVTRLQLAVTGNFIPKGGYFILVDDAVLQRIFTEEDRKEKDDFVHAASPEEKNPPPVPEGKNLLRNSGFETVSAEETRIPGWYTYSPNGARFTTASNDGRKKTRAFKICGHGSIIQFRKVTPGEKYYAEAWFRGSFKADAVIQIRYKQRGAWIKDHTLETEVIRPVSWQWRKISAVVTVPPGAAEMHVMLGARRVRPGEFVLIDDAVVKKFSSAKIK